MKEIRIEVRPQLLARMHDALRACLGFPGMTVATVQAYPPVPAGTHSLKEDLTEFVQRVRIEIVTSDEQAETFYEAAVRVLEQGRTGESSIRMSEVVRATFLHRR
jgi:nitrogen regulatory protein P-II 1